MLTLDLRSKDGKVHHYTQTFVPVKKMIELMKLTPKNYPDLDETGWMEKNAEFMATLFDSPEVTKDAILDGVASWDFDNLMDKLNNEILGIDPKKSLPKRLPKKKP